MYECTSVVITAFQDVPEKNQDLYKSLHYAQRLLKENISSQFFSRLKYIFREILSGLACKDFKILSP